MVKAVRGAAHIKKDTEEEVIEKTASLLDALITRNHLDDKKIVSIQFTVTQDIRSLNPATALRKKINTKAPLFCALEPDFPGNLPRVIRVLVTVRVAKKQKMEPVYLGKTRLLRADLFQAKG